MENSEFQGESMKAFMWVLLAIVCAVCVPCIVTFCVNGRQKDAMTDLSQISTGRDVLVQTEDGNKLVDIEEYIAHIMPGIVDASTDDSYLQAQAVVLRTQIYKEMGQATVLQAKDLEYQYYTEKDYIAKWGKEHYKSVKSRYDQAVLATVGKTIESQDRKTNQ